MLFIDGLNIATLNAIVIEINPKGEFSVVGVLISGNKPDGFGDFVYKVKAYVFLII